METITLAIAVVVVLVIMPVCVTMFFAYIGMSFLWYCGELAWMYWKCCREVKEEKVQLRLVRNDEAA